MSCCLDADVTGRIVVMYVVRVPNRGSPPAILLRESYREDGKVKNRTLANLSSWPASTPSGPGRPTTSPDRPARPKFPLISL